MVLLFVLALALPALGGVNIEATLGWGGVPVLGRVNPLWVTVDNPSGTPVVGVLEVDAEIGSPWRGRAERGLTAPVVLAPGGKTTFLFPWPLQRGTRELFVSLFSDSGSLAATSLPVAPAVAPLSGTVGEFGQGVLLSPADLDDPLLLHALGEIGVSTPLAQEERAVLLAWAAFLGGKLSGLSSLSPWPWPDREGLVRAFSRLDLPHPPLAPLAAGVAAYLLGIGFFLPPAARGRFRLPGLFLCLALGLSLFCPLLYDTVSGVISCRWSLFDGNVPGFHLEFVALTGMRDCEWRWDGVWVELLPVEEGSWAGRYLRWEWEEGGVVTVVPVRPGTVRVLWRLATGEPGGGEAFRWEGELVRLRDGRKGELATLVSPAFQPLWEAIYPRLSPGARLRARAESLREDGGMEWRLTLEVAGGG